jgi:hypothetical protein
VKITDEELAGNLQLAASFVGTEPNAAAFRLHEQACRLRQLEHRLHFATKANNNNFAWWETYRAALSGCYARLGPYPAETSETWAHKTATKAADTAHGPLQEIEEVPL